MAYSYTPKVDAFTITALMKQGTIPLKNPLNPSSLYVYFVHYIIPLYYGFFILSAYILDFITSIGIAAVQAHIPAIPPDRS